ncbi:hypothetical protein H0P40_26075, partial [Escherichia coli]|nr:hypothetical protein [Escherichia coli]
MLPSETMIWQPEFTDKILSRKPGAVHPAPPRHVNPLAMPEHFNPAIFCLGVFTRNEERTTGYRPVSPVSGKKTSQYLHRHGTKRMKYRRDIHLLSLKPLPERALWCNHPLTEHGILKSIVKKTDINKVPFVSRVFWFSVIRNICLPERKTNLINQNGILQLFVLFPVKFPEKCPEICFITETQREIS